MNAMNFTEPEERAALRAAVAELGKKYGHEYYSKQARAGLKTEELWAEAGRLGYLGVNLPEEYGGGGAGIADLAAVLEELAAAGCPLLLMVVSPAICGTVISRFGTDEQKKRWLPGIADGSRRMVFAITEPDAGSNSHKITTTAKRDGGDWVLSGRKVYISGVDEADAVLVVGRTEDSKTGKLKPALFIVPTDSPGFEYKQIEMDIVSPEKQFGLFLDDVHLPADALVGEEDAAIAQLFAGLNPERIMGASFSLGIARYALGKAVAYANERKVWRGEPIGTHQGLAPSAGRDQDRAGTGQAHDAEGGVALRLRRRLRRGRVGEHGEVRGRRGRDPRRRPGRADPRRQRSRQRVRAGHAGRGRPARPDRAGEPRDGAQLRRPAQPRPAPLLLRRRP